MEVDKLKALVKLIKLLKARTSKKTKSALDGKKKSDFLDKLKKPELSSNPKSSEKVYKEDNQALKGVNLPKVQKTPEKVYKEGADMSGMAGYLPNMNDEVNMDAQREKLVEQKPYDRIEKKDKKK